MPGEDWGAAIVEAIQSSRVMVLVFSSHANASPQIRREVELAVEEEVILIPFRIEDVAPAQSLKYFIGTRHWLDALTPPLEAHLARLVPTVERLVAAGERVNTAVDVRKPASASNPLRLMSRRSKIIFGAIAAAILLIITTVSIAGHVSTRSASAQVVLPFTGLYHPYGVVVDGAGAVYVTDLNNRVVQVAAGASTQTALPFSDLGNPTGVALGRAGAVYVADYWNNRVLRLVAGARTQMPLPFTRAERPWQCRRSMMPLNRLCHRLGS